jgi:cell division protein FtsQ
LASLPKFVGQPENSIEISKQYAELQTLLRPISKDILQVYLSPRFAWQVQLNNGMTVELGREQMAQRLTRFVAVYPYSLAAWDGMVKHVDLRYRNGFAAYFPNGMVVKRNSEKKV